MKRVGALAKNFGNLKIILRRNKLSPRPVPMFFKTFAALIKLARLTLTLYSNQQLCITYPGVCELYA
jgi:hypothetical protein